VTTTAPAVGEMYTVTPHVVPHGAQVGRFHCLVLGGERDGKVHICQMKIGDDGKWRRSMQTVVYSTALVPLEVQLDLFGEPAGGAR
jgi:hypothetical protein